MPDKVSKGNFKVVSKHAGRVAVVKVVLLVAQSFYRVGNGRSYRLEAHG